MKSKFAKFIDGTIGAMLIFLAATAVFRYYTTLELALFCASTVTACAVMLLKIKSNKHCAGQRLSAAADKMFYDFMFLAEDAPIKLLARGLNAKGTPTKRHGGGVFANGTAAYFCAAPVDIATSARLIAKAKHFGAKKLVILGKTKPSVPNIDAGIKIHCVYGDDAYRLFASLDCLPESGFAPAPKKRLSALCGALSKDKLVRYSVLSAAFLLVSWLSKSVITFVCSMLCAALTLAGLIYAVATARKERTNE